MPKSQLHQYLLEVDRDSLIEGIKTFYATFPDNTHVIDDLMAEGNKVVQPG